MLSRVEASPAVILRGVQRPYYDPERSEVEGSSPPIAILNTVKNLSLYPLGHKIICYNNHITSEYTKETYGKEESNF
jgi:hypothetical protein